MAFGVDHAFNPKWPAYWGDKTSTLDWCEENYEYSQFIAEFWNATSNFFFIYIAIAGMRETRKSGMPMRFTILYAWLLVVGLGSLLFHATLKWSMQLLDEIPLIFMASHVLHCVVYPDQEKNGAWWRKSVWPLYSISMAVALAYAYIGNPIFHQVCFGALIAACAARYPYFASSNTQTLKDAKELRQKCFYMFLRAAGLMVGAFGIWNVDNVACGQLRSMRSALWGPFVILRPLLQFHAVWHVLTIAAADYTVAGLLYVWCQGRRKYIKASLKYKLWGTFPLVSITPKSSKSSKSLLKLE